MAFERTYYRGAARVILDGIPCRMRRKPSKWYFEEIKKFEKLRKENRTTQEKAIARARDARNAIEAYAAALGTDVRHAKALIERHRLHRR